MNRSPSERLELLRQLGAKYWRPLLSWTAVISAVVVNGLKALKFKFVTLSPAVTLLIPLGVFVIIYVLYRFPRMYVAITRLIAGPPKPLSNLPAIFRGPRPYGRDDVLPARQKDIDDCWLDLKDASFFLLEGESGCGKSSLLNAALLPRAQEAFRVIECRVADDPFIRPRWLRWCP